MSLLLDTIKFASNCNIDFVIFENIRISFFLPKIDK